jgi:hypothetical protein
MRPLRRTALLALALLAALAAAPSNAQATVAAAGTQAGRATRAAGSTSGKQSSVFCEVAGPVIEGIVPVIGRLVGVEENVCEGAGEAVSDAAGAVGNSVLNAVATWMIGAATQVTTFVADAMTQTTTPQLRAAWFATQFAPMADLGGALAFLVTLIAFTSAAIRRDPQALAGALAGIVRAGLGTDVIVALTTLGLEVTDQISTAVLSNSPHTFWVTVAQAWGTKGFGGFSSSALATLIAAIETVSAFDVWVELIVRGAAIYLAVLFFPVTLAAGIWPALGAWPGRLARLLLLFVILKPVALIVLSLAGNAAAAGLSLNGSIPNSVGTILTAIVIFALASFMPWAIMYLLAADAESAYLAASVRSAAGAAIGDLSGRSLRTAGGLRNLSSRIPARGGGTLGGGPSGDSGPPGDRGLPGDHGLSSGGGPSGGRGLFDGGSSAADAGPSGAHPAANGLAPGTGAAGEIEWASPIAAEAVGTGSVGAAAGIASPVRPASTDLSSTAGGAPRAHTPPLPRESSAGAPTQERHPTPPVERTAPPRPTTTPRPTTASPPTSGARHLRLVPDPGERPEAEDGDHDDPDTAA